MILASTIKRFHSHCAAYRGSVDRLLRDDLCTPNEFASTCRLLQLSTSELQVDRHLLLEMIPRIRLSSRPLPPSKRDHIGVERDLRTRLRPRLESLAIWSLFNSANPLAQAVGLMSSEDFLRNLELHLPEIYGETLFLEQQTALLMEHRNHQIAADIMVGLQHMGRNHISFLQPALDWLSDEDSWV